VTMRRAVLLAMIQTPHPWSPRVGSHTGLANHLCGW
jgi:hypothetical protein